MYRYVAIGIAILALILVAAIKAERKREDQEVQKLKDKLMEPTDWLNGLWDEQEDDGK